MTDEITYRQVEETDASLIVSVDESRYGLGKALSIFYVKDCCKLYNETFFVATVKDRIIGFCIGLSSKSKETGWISAVTVSEDYKGNGIGENLVKNVCEKLKNAGCSAVSLTAEPNLVAYYEKLSFVRISEELKNYYGEGEHRFILRKTF